MREIDRGRLHARFSESLCQWNATFLERQAVSPDRSQTRARREKRAAHSSRIEPSTCDLQDTTKRPVDNLYWIAGSRPTRHQFFGTTGSEYRLLKTVAAMTPPSRHHRRPPRHHRRSSPSCLHACDAISIHICDTAHEGERASTGGCNDLANDIHSGTVGPAEPRRAEDATRGRQLRDHSHIACPGDPRRISH